MVILRYPLIIHSVFLRTVHAGYNTVRLHQCTKIRVIQSYLGLASGEDSSGDRQNRLGITKAGNQHLRCLLTEARNLKADMKTSLTE